MKHSDRGRERFARNVRVGHTISWCGRACRVVQVSFPSPRGKRQPVVLSVEAPEIGRHDLNYEASERVLVLDYDDPRLADSCAEDAVMTGEHPPAPEMDAPRSGSWVGEWTRSALWDTSMPDDAAGDPCWMREYLLHDGHEECCHHTPMSVWCWTGEGLGVTEPGQRTESMFWHLTRRGQVSAAYYLVRRLVARPAFPTSQRCMMGSPVDSMVWCPRRVGVGGVWCPHHEREISRGRP